MDPLNVSREEPWNLHFSVLHRYSVAYWNFRTIDPEYSSLLYKYEKMLHKHCHYAPHVILEVEMNRIGLFVVLFVRFCGFFKEVKDMQIVQEDSMHDKDEKKWANMSSKGRLIW